MRYVVSRMIPTGSVILLVTTFSSYALGLVRDRIFAQTYGLSNELDAYNAAFLLPDLLFNVLVASGIAAAAVPLFSDLRQKHSKHALEYINSLLSAAVLTMLVAALLFFFFAGSASALIAPGLSPDSQALTAQLMRLLALSPILFAISNGLGALLVAEKRFLHYGLSPVFYNLGIIGGTYFLAPMFGVLGAVYGTIAGAGLHASVRILGAWRAGWRPSISWQWRTDEFRRTIRLMLPKMIGHPVELVMFWVFTSLASTLAAGSIAALNFARNFQSVPVSLIGITMSTAAFPVLAAAASRHDVREFRSTLRRISISVFGISVIAAVALFLIRYPLIRILLGGGEFGVDDAARTATILGIFCLAIPTESLNHLLARSFYAQKNTIIPVSFSVIALLIAAGAGWAMLPRFSLIALPLAFFFGSFVKTTGLACASWIRANRQQ